MSLRDMCVLEPATAAPRKARRKIGGAGSRTGRAIRHGIRHSRIRKKAGRAARRVTEPRRRAAAHGHLSPDRESYQPGKRPERGRGGGVSVGRAVARRAGGRAKILSGAGGADRVHGDHGAERRAGLGAGSQPALEPCRSGRRSGKTRSWRARSRLPCRMN